MNLVSYGKKSRTLVRKSAPVLGVGIDAISWEDALSRIAAWSGAYESRYVCICNVHSVVTASRDVEFGRVVNQADMATPDGAPVAWMLRRLGHAGQQRINGPDLMWRYCEVLQEMECRAGRHCEERSDAAIAMTEVVGDGLPRFARNDGDGDAAWTDRASIFLYGSSEQTLATLKAKLLAAFPALNIAGAISPPFRTLTEDEDAAIVAQINASGAGVVFVSLGCPKQELWMAAHRGRINAVMIGVGAAFDYHAGTIQRAPKWMQDCGLEWLHRLASEPGRLWRRYLVTNTLFVLGAARQLLLARRQAPR